MRNREEVFEKVKKVTLDLLDGADLTEESSFVNDLGADSLDALELCMEIEKEFDLYITDNEFAEISTVGQLVDYLMDKQTN